MFLAQNRLRSGIMPCALLVATGLVIMPEKAVAASFKASTGPAIVAMAAKGAGKAKVAGSAIGDIHIAKSAKGNQASAKSSKSFGGAKSQDKSSLSVMQVIRGSVQALRFYPKGRVVPLNARICLKEGVGFLTFQHKAGGMVTYGDGGCNMVAAGGAPTDKKARGSWGG